MTHIPQGSNTRYNFYSGNRMDGHHTKSAQEIADDFKQSEEYAYWQQGGHFIRSLSVFLAARYGTGEHEEFQQLVNELKPLLQ